MTFRTAVCGLMLVIIGVSGYQQGTPNPDTGELPKTALIPAAFGAVLLACAGLVAWQESLRKHVMHVAAMVGVLGFLGGFAPIIRKLSKGDAIDIAAPAIRNGVLMSAICLLFVFLCVKSFIDAKKARGERGASAP